MQRILRAATRDDHIAVDGDMAGFDLTQPTGYCAFLLVHRAALAYFEPDWRDADRADWQAMWHCLDHDLQAFAMCTVEPPPAPRAPRGTAGLLGVAYVIRGSRLGCAVLKRRVPKTFSASYLNFNPALSWREFLTVLAQKPLRLRSGWEADVIDGARATFSMFRKLSQSHLAGLGLPTTVLPSGLARS